MKFTYRNMDFLPLEHNENLAVIPLRHTGGPLAAPYAGYRVRHLNQHGPVKELKDFSIEELRNLGDKYGFDVEVMDG